MKVKRISLVACLFLFLFVVIGNALHLNPAGAFLAAATGTPLLIYIFNQRVAVTTAGQRPNPVPRAQVRVGDPNHDRAHPSGWENDSVIRE
jgi:threonine/homoserine efflux transporter RhtA